jgi:hypothetical protein
MRRYVASKVDQCSNGCMSLCKARELELEKFKFVFCVPGMCISALANSGLSSSPSIELF